MDGDNLKGGNTTADLSFEICTTPDGIPHAIADTAATSVFFLPVA
jgi:hypothetical protein